MLETTLSTQYIPGTNVKGEIAGANWTFLLPSLELGRVLCLGVLPPVSLVTLSNRSQEVFILTQESRIFQPSGKTAIPAPFSNLHFLKANGNKELPGAPMDLVVACQQGLLWLLRDQDLRQAVKQLLSPGGLLYFQLSPLDHVLKGQAVNRLCREFGGWQRFWLTPGKGEMQTAIFWQDHQTAKYFLRKRMTVPSFRPAILEKAERLLFITPHLKNLVCRSAVLAGPAAISGPVHAPAYLKTSAKNAGIDLDRYRWALSARGQFKSRKVLFFLFERSTGAPEIVVKMTRDPSLNSRLENEYRALTWLQAQRIGDPEILPQPLFYDVHAGLSMMGETLVAGIPFRKAMQRASQSGFGRSAADWLVELGAATADRNASTPSQVASGLTRLFNRFQEIYTLSSGHQAFLEEQINTIRASKKAFPLVFQHGDPGAWNLMVTPGGRVAFLDWEAAELQGMPLWDLFYFLRSYAVSSSPQGLYGSLKAFENHFLDGSPLTPLILYATRRYCERVDLSSHLVRPLFYTCWMHRALKQATRLPVHKLQGGHYISLLRLSIDHSNAPALQRLLDCC